jgi:hypothetical protein
MNGQQNKSPPGSIDLQQFCSTEKYRPYLHAPSSLGNFTYATNGHIIIRVKRLSNVPENSSFPDTERLFAANYRDSEFRPMVSGTLPPLIIDEAETCDACDGTGFQHRCPDCQCECSGCGGAGKVRTTSDNDTSVSINGAVFDIRYVRMLQSLPGTLIESLPRKEEAMSFRFDGGEGMLMPMRSTHAKHLDIEL